jgi:GrpB-like predicted nucleotidyltransferase (UPF0157 family)
MILLPYDPDWAFRFEIECAMLERILHPWLEGGIHHIGSTSVPGLAAKPIVDMMAGVRNLDEARSASSALSMLGYVYRPHRPEAHRFHREGYHLHLTRPGSDLWRERLGFRDALRADPALREEYAAWKEAHRGEDGYTAGKRPLVQRVLAARGLDLKPDEERLAPEELERRGLQ